MASSQALQAALSTVGIKTMLKGYPSGSYYATFAGSPSYVHSHGLGLAAGGWGADWPGAYGWAWGLFDSAAIVPSGNANISELNDLQVNRWLASLEQATLSASARDAIGAEIDMKVMKDAVMLPAVYSKVLLYRSPSLTNVYVQPYYGMYDYAVFGTR